MILRIITNLLSLILTANLLLSCSSLKRADRTVASTTTWESYLTRPDILSVQPIQHEEGLLENWKELRRAHLEAIALLVEMYPDHHLYFLARDAELLYDTAKLALQNEPEKLAKIHLVNISRANMYDKNIINYLAQEGISNETLESGRKVLFVDSGFNGSIPSFIERLFPFKYSRLLQTHLLCSKNANFPSIRSFLYWQNPEVLNYSADVFRASIRKYEEIVHFTEYSSYFDLIDNSWQPMSELYSDNLNRYDKKVARYYMEDIKFYVESPLGREQLKEGRLIWRNLSRMLSERQTSMEKFMTTLLKLLENGSVQERGYRESIILDLFDIIKTNNPQNSIFSLFSDMAKEFQKRAKAHFGRDCATLLSLIVKK